MRNGTAYGEAEHLVLWWKVLPNKLQKALSLASLSSPHTVRSRPGTSSALP
ncbi:hypothetical protein [Streptomyces sp. enrichment culture]|uniref:hypothetical protein n=1 Tax=Streptomyces sp. enrichment culture TaxID=1795815 RepID=UPI003F54281E